MTGRRSDTEEAVLEALSEGGWVYRYLGGSKALGDRVSAVWRDRFPDRRNRPSHRNIEAALKNLVAAGVVERKEGQHDTLYRLVLR